MKTTTKQPWKLGLHVAVAVLVVNLVIGLGTALLIAPTTEHEQVLQHQINSDREFLETGFANTGNPSPTLQKSINANATKEGSYIASVDQVTSIILFVALVISTYAGYRYIRSKTTSNSVERIATFAVGLPIILLSILSPVIMNLFVNTSGWVETTYGSWVFWILALTSSAITLFVIGLISHILERRYKKKHSFEIE